MNRSALELRSALSRWWSSESELLGPALSSMTDLAISLTFSVVILEPPKFCSSGDDAGGGGEGGGGVGGVGGEGGLGGGAGRGWLWRRWRRLPNRAL